MTQMVLVMADGGTDQENEQQETEFMSEPYHHFDQNRSTYRYIEQRLLGTKESYLEADPYTRLRILFDAVTYSLLTANTPLKQADRAFEVYRDHYPDMEPETLGTDFAENGIGFYSNKSTYICDNADMFEEIFIPADKALVDGRDDEAQQILMEAQGIGPAKSAFSLAMLGWTDHVCLDTHTCQQLGIDPGEYEKYSSDEYKQLADDAFDQIPRLRDEVSDFLCQWVLFDLNRGEIETHGLWFSHVASVVR